MTTQGIDVSMYQGDINFNQVKSAGYNFVIIRMNNWNTAKQCTEADPYFVKNYNNAKAAGLNVGAYWFTNADDLNYAKTEISMCKSLLKGKSFEFPIYVDVEREQQFKQGKTFCTQLVQLWCDELEKFGAFAGVYCSRYWYTNFVDEKVRERYACWIADWASTCTYKGSYGVWQNSTANVPGVTGKVDHDYGYIDYPTIIKNAKRNNWIEEQTDYKAMYEEQLAKNVEANTKIKTLEAEVKKLKQAIEYAQSALKGVV